MYDPNPGRWLTEDPIGFDAGDYDLYRYVGNNPTNKTDPSGLDDWTEDSARSALQDQIKAWQDAGWKYPANLLQHFLDNTGKLYVASAEEVAEVKPRADKMVRVVLSVIGKDFQTGSDYPIKMTTRVRWVSESAETGVIDWAITKDFFVLKDEFMFAAYGGATLEIEGKATNVKRDSHWFCPDKITFDANVKVTLKDTYEFGETGPLGARKIFKNYSAAHYLQTQKKYKQFDDKLTYTETFKDVTFVEPIYKRYQWYKIHHP